MAGARKQYELLIQLKATYGNNFAQTFNNARRALKDMQGSIEKVNSVQKNISGYRKQQEALEKNKTKLQTLAQEHDRLQREISETEEPTENMRRALERNENQIQRTTQSIENQERSLESLQEELRVAGVNTDNLDASTERLERQYQRLQRSQERIGDLSNRIERNNQAIQRTRGKIVGIISLLATLGAIIYTGPVKSAMAFQSNMAEVAKVVDWLKDDTGKVTKEYTELKKEILSITTQIPMTAKEITEIMAAAGQSNVAKNNKQLIAFTESAAKMGIAFDTTSEQAGTWMAKWRTSFGMTQKEVIELSDKINYLGNTSAANAIEISSIVTKIGPLGDVAGLASGEIAALGASLVATGVQEDVAATGIKNLMIAMTAGKSITERQAGVLKKLGINSTDLAKRMQTDAKGAIMDFLKAVKKLPKAEQAAALNNYFGKTSIAALAPLLTNLGYLEEQFNKVGDASLYAGSMEAEYAARADTVENKVQLAKNSLQALSTTVGDALLPAVGGAAEKLTVLVNHVTRFAENNPKAIRTIAKVSAGLLALKAGGLIAKLGFLEIKGGVLAVQRILAIFSGRILTTNTNAMRLGSNFSVLGSNVVGYFSSVKGALGGVGVAFSNAFGSSAIVIKIKAFTSLISGKLITGIVGLYGKFASLGVLIGGKLMTGILAPLAGIGGKIGAIILSGPIGKIGSFIYMSVMSGLSRIIPLFAPIGNLLKVTFAPIGRLMGPIAGKLLPVIIILTLIISAVKLIKDNMEKVRTTIQNVFGDKGLEIFDKIVAVISSVANTIKNAFSNGNIGNVREKINNIFGGKGVKVFDIFMKGIRVIISTFSTLVSFISTHVAPVVGQMFNVLVTSVIPFLISTIKTIAPVVGQIMSAVVGFIGQAVTLIGVAITGLMPVISVLLSFIQSYLIPILQSVLAVVQFIMPTIQAIISAGVTAISSVIQGFITVLQGIIQFITGVFTGNWSQAWEGVKTVFSGIFGAIEGIAKGAINGVISIINTAIRGINKVKVPGTKGANVKEIPKFAKGTNKTPDTFIAGEEGPELITGAAGRKVFTAMQTQNIFNGMVNKSNVSELGTTSAPGLKTSNGMIQITINNNPQITATNGDANEIESLLKQANEEILLKVKALVKQALSEAREQEERVNYA